MTTKLQIGTLSCTLACLLLSTTAAFAKDEHFYLGGSLGASIANLGNTNPQNNIPNSTVVESFPPNSKHATAGIFSLNAGYEFVGISLKPAISIGLGIYRNLNSYNFNGKRIQSISGLPGGTTLNNYKYSLNSARLMAEVQLIWILGKFAPFVNFGMGRAWNQATGYSETLVNGASLPPPFRSHTSINFAYQGGFGVSYLFNFSKAKADFQTERLSLGYRFVDVGDATFTTRGSPFAYSLDTGRLKASDIYFSYTHLF